MSNRNHHYRDPDFDTQHSAGYTLLVKAYPDTFAYAVTDNNKLLVLEDGNALSELSSTAGGELLSLAYKDIIITLPYTGFTFVPLSLFQPARVADFARFLDIKDDELVFSQSLDDENQVIFKVNKAHVDLVNKFDTQNMVFAAKGWIKAIAANHPDNKNIYLNIEGDKVELLNFKESKLRFYNSFEFKNEAELVYFASFVAGELQLQPQDITLVLSGGVDNGDKNFKYLAEFFQNIMLSNLSPLELPGEIPAHTVFTFTALALCGSSAVH